LTEKQHNLFGFVAVSDAELAAVAIERDEFHGEWNYRIKPRPSRRKI
jgi:hypothetical protein